MTSSNIGTLALLVAIAPAALTGQEAEGQGGGDRLQERLRQVQERLALTPEQVEQVRPVLAEELEEMRALRDKYRGGGQGRRARRQLARDLREIRSETDERLKAILSAEQMEELKKMREEWRQEIRDRAGTGRRRGGRR